LHERYRASKLQGGDTVMLTTLKQCKLITRW